MKELRPAGVNGNERLIAIREQSVASHERSVASNQ